MKAFKAALLDKFEGNPSLRVSCRAGTPRASIFRASRQFGGTVGDCLKICIDRHADLPRLVAVPPLAK